MPSSLCFMGPCGECERGGKGSSVCQPDDWDSSVELGAHGSQTLTVGCFCVQEPKD